MRTVPAWKQVLGNCLGHLGLLAVVASAQGRVWIVDAQNGPGAHFTDLPPAVAAASDGDQIRMRAGAYQGTVVGKALVLIGATGATVGQSSQPLTVQGLPAGRQVVLQGFTVVNAMMVVNNQGRVLLDRLAASEGPGSGPNPFVTITDSGSVQINGCSFQRAALVLPFCTAITTLRSTVVIADSQLRGGDGIRQISGFSSPALQTDLSDVTVSGGTIQGGNGAYTTFSQPGILSTASRLVVTGDTGTWIRAGQGSGLGWTSAIVANSGSVTYDPHVALISSNPSMPPISGGATVVTTWLPSLSAQGANPGNVVVADLFSPVGDGGVLLASLAADPLDLSPAGWFWLDPNRFVVAGLGVVDPLGYLRFSLPVPNDPGLSFFAWGLQSLSGTINGGFRLSNPVGVALTN